MALKKFGEFETSHNEAKQEQMANAWKVLDDGEREIIDVQWRTAGKWGTVGIVAVRNTKMNYWTAYIGVSAGRDEKADAVEIADWGSKMVEKEAKAFFPHIQEKYKDTE